MPQSLPFVPLVDTQLKEAGCRMRLFRSPVPNTPLLGPVPTCSQNFRHYQYHTVQAELTAPQKLVAVCNGIAEDCSASQAALGGFSDLNRLLCFYTLDLCLSLQVCTAGFNSPQ